MLLVPCCRWLHTVVRFPAVADVPAIVGVPMLFVAYMMLLKLLLLLVNSDPDVALALFAAVLKSQTFWTVDLSDLDYRTENFFTIGLSITGPVPKENYGAIDYRTWGSNYRTFDYRNQLKQSMPALVYRIRGKRITIYKMDK